MTYEGSDRVSRSGCCSAGSDCDLTLWRGVSVTGSLASDSQSRDMNLRMNKLSGW